MSKKAGSPGRWSYYWVLLSPRGTWWYLETWLEESNEGELLNICADYCGDGIVKKKKKKWSPGLAMSDKAPGKFPDPSGAYTTTTQ